MKYNANFEKFFKDRGTIILNDTSLVLIGKRHKFFIPIFGLFASFWKKVLVIDTMRTIPYSVILQYKNPNSTLHEITYQSPHGKKILIRFSIYAVNASVLEHATTNASSLRKTSSEASKSFKEQLQEKIALTKTFLGS